MPDLIARARAVVDALERDDAAAVAALRSPRIADWDPAPWMRESWTPRLDQLAGADRGIVDGREVHDQLVRFRVVGDAGEAFVTVLMDADGVYGLDVAREHRDGGFGICIGCAREQRDSLETFWRGVVDAPLGFGDGGGSPPRWPDPAHPQQLHLDVLVSDLDVAETEVLARGATKLEDSGAFRVYADPVGHPFCLYADPSTQPEDPHHVGVLARVVIDCPDPSILADFWSGLLDMPVRLSERADRIVIGRADQALPNIALQRISDYHPPQWPDPEHPEQLHFDISFDDREERERLALRLGATRLPAQGGSCPAYADPAGHPFCLCMTGE